MLNLWMSHATTADEETEQVATLEIVHGLASRLRKKTALNFLKCLRESGFHIDTSPLERELHKTTKSDFYYNYYGYWIMGFQILLTGSLKNS